MNVRSCVSRRAFFGRTGVAGMAIACARWPLETLLAAEPPADDAKLIGGIIDPEIRHGVEAAIVKNIIPAATEKVYPGHFTITADGGAYGNDTTWPGLDSWQMAGAYLLLGRRRLVLDYFEFVRASQRKDGNIPFAIFTGDTKPGGCLRGLKSPDDIFSYRPPKRDSLPPSSQETRQWIGLFEHWQPRANPLSTLGAVCYILTAAEIHEVIGSAPWLRERLASIQAAAKHLLTRRTDNGLIGGSGFYTEAPPRYGWDGITQCYAIHAFRRLAALCSAAEDTPNHAAWSAEADRLTRSFTTAFWRDDHFAEYIHAERGLVDSHGLSDVNWAAVAFGISADRHLAVLWPRLLKERGFWLGGMPTQTVTRPFAYEKWEHSEPVPIQFPPLNDVAAMGRAWYVEAMACQRMSDRDRLVESARKVCQAGKATGYWRERYHPRADGTVTPAGADKYCEYPAVLIRVVLGNRAAFCR